MTEPDVSQFSHCEGEMFHRKKRIKYGLSCTLYWPWWIRYWDFFTRLLRKNCAKKSVSIGNSNKNEINCTPSVLLKNLCCWIIIIISFRKCQSQLRVIYFVRSYNFLSKNGWMDGRRKANLFIWTVSNFSVVSLLWRRKFLTIKHTCMNIWKYENTITVVVDTLPSFYY